MGFKLEKDVWVIVTKDRKGIVKGHTGDRWLAYVKGVNHQKKPINMYPTRGMAVYGRDSGVFRNYTVYSKSDLEVVKMRFTLEEIEED